jgi:hypothetical protein
MFPFHGSENAHRGEITKARLTSQNAMPKIRHVAKLGRKIIQRVEGQVQPLDIRKDKNLDGK